VDELGVGALSGAQARADVGSLFRLADQRDADRGSFGRETDQLVEDLLPIRIARAVTATL